MMPNWTPGPYARLGQSAQIVNAAGRTIGHADTQFQDAQQAEATTDLFAAAPELYEALEQAVDFIDGYVAEVPPRARARMFQTWNAALAKARGEK